jgi:hypothetical protein
MRFFAMICRRLRECPRCGRGKTGTEMTESASSGGTITPASAILQRLHDSAPADHVTLAWLIGNIPGQSYGLIMLLLAIIAAAPGISLVAGLLLFFPALQMIVNRPGPSFPGWIANRPISTRHLSAVVQRSIRVLKYLEGAVHPRWPAFARAAKSLVGITVILLTARLLLAPIPLSNVLPAFLIGLISLAYLEEDGIVLSIGILLGLTLIAFDLRLVWDAIHGANRLGL